MLLLAGLLIFPKHIVLLAGDEEYRSEEMLPQFAQILTQRHGFKCTVVYSINSKGEIDPEERHNQPGIEALDTADVCVMMLRFREWPDDQMRHFVNYYRSGKPILAIRTSTHAFSYAPTSMSPYKAFANGFGKQVLGESWVSHWGNHGSQATRGHIVHSHPVLRGVQDVFGTTDVYEADPPADAEVLVRGEVVAGMKATDPPAKSRKKTAKGVEQELNDPMMPIVWTRSTPNQIVTTTMGAATDFLNPGYRRLLVNAAYWITELPVPASANVTLVGTYDPSPFGFGAFKRGTRPEGE